jgi:hypothetical protein
MIKTPKKWILECSANFEEDFQCNKTLPQNRFIFLIMINCTHSDLTIFEGIVEGLMIYMMDQNLHIKNWCFHRKALQMR